MRIKRTRKQWLELFSKQKKSGMSVKEYCKEEGINQNIFYKKRKEYYSRCFVKLPDSISLKQRSIKIKIDDIVIEVDADCSKSCLTQIISSVMEVAHAHLR